MNTMTTPTLKRDPWSWIPTLYFAEGLPYVAVMTIAVIMYKRLGLSNTEIALYTSWLYLPWTIKPLWSPFVDLIKTKRAWIIAMQGFISAGFAGIAFFIPTTHYVQFTLAFFWLLAFRSSACPTKWWMWRLTTLPKWEWNSSRTALSVRRSAWNNWKRKDSRAYS